MGFTPAAGAFSAAETGAPHERLRVFIVAFRHAVSNDRRESRGPGWRSEPAIGGRPVDDAAGRAGRLHEGQGPAGQRAPDAGGRGRDVADTDTDADAGRMDCRAVGRSSGRGEGESEERKRVWFGPRRGGDELADAERDAGHERGRGRGFDPEADRDREATGPSASRPNVQPPGPGDRAAWADVIRSDPSRAPAFARRDAASAALRVASLLSPEQAASVVGSAGGVAIEDILAAVEREAPELVGEASALTGFRDLAYGLAERARALRLLGNGVHPLAAGHAWRSLSVAHGLRPVDLEAAGRDESRCPDELSVRAAE